MIKWNPAGHRVLIKPDIVKERTEGGIYLPEQTQDAQQNQTSEGVILKIGKTAWVSVDNGEPWCKVGQRITYVRHSGFNLYGDGEIYTVINDQDIISFIPEVEKNDA